MRSAALAEEVERRSVKGVPVLRLTLVSRGYALDPVIAAPVKDAFAAGRVTHVTLPGGWDAIEYGSGLEGKLEAVTTAVTVSDPDGSLLSLLDAYNPDGSAASIDWALPGLMVADWEPLFRGVLEDWSRDGAGTKLHLKTDDTLLRTPIPASTFERALSGSAAEATVVGSPRSLVFGVHDAFSMTARGQVPATCTRYDTTIPAYWWEASVGNLVEVRRVAVNGVVQPDSGWSTLRQVTGQSNATIISFAAGSQPQRGDVVTFDCEGPDEDGLAVGAAITNPVRIMRDAVGEYALRAAPLAGFRGDHPLFDDDSWDAAEAWFDAHGYDCGKRFGGDQNATDSAAEVIESFMASKPWCRIFFTELGTLGFTIIDPDDVDPDAALAMNLETSHVVVPFKRGDAREVYSHVRQPFLWSSADGKFASSYEAHDLGTSGATPPLVVEDHWSQARYTLE